MNFKKEVWDIYTTKEKAFSNFYELTCHMSLIMTEEYKETRNALYPDGVDSFEVRSLGNLLLFEIWIITDFGYYHVRLKISLVEGSIDVYFNKDLYLNKGSNDFSNNVELTDSQFTIVVDKCLPIVKSIINTLSKLKRDYPCSSDCIYQNKKGENGECDETYTLKKVSLSKKKTNKKCKQ